MKWKNNILYQAYADIKNFFLFKKDILRERRNLASKFNAYKLRLNSLGNCVYSQKVLSDTQMKADDQQKYLFLVDMCRVENNYFTNELGWGEYLTFDLYNFVDDNGYPTNTYGVVWKFTPYALFSYKLYWTLFLTLLGGFGLAYLICYFWPFV